METHLIHQREADSDTERHLQENISKYETDAVFLYKLMLNGERLTAKDVMQKYGIHDRCLRDLQISGKCQKEWKLNEAGKRLYVEYFVTTPKQLSKSEVIERAHKATNNLRVAESTLVTVFSLPDDETPASYHQQSLFQ